MIWQTKSAFKITIQNNGVFGFCGFLWVAVVVIDDDEDDYLGGSFVVVVVVVKVAVVG